MLNGNWKTGNFVAAEAGFFKNKQLVVKNF